jgi:hypothetical protein
LLLIEHTLSLLHSNEVNIDRAADIIADAVSNQGPTVDAALAQQAKHASPAQAAELIRQAWAESVRGVVVAEPVPGDVETMQRRHRTRARLAAGPIQQFVAGRLGHLELFAFTMTAEQPALRVTVANMLSASAGKRADMTDALQQAIEIERVLAQLHALRMQQASAPKEPES